MTISHYLGSEMSTVPRREGLLASQYVDYDCETKHMRLVGGMVSGGSFYGTAKNVDNGYVTEAGVTYNRIIGNISCDGPPESPVDASNAQPSTADPVTSASTCWNEYCLIDYKRSTVTVYVRPLLNKTTNAYICDADDFMRLGSPVLGFYAFNNVSLGSSIYDGTNWVVSTPGTLTKTSLDNNRIDPGTSNLVSVPFKVPCYVGRWGFKGAANQVLAGGANRTAKHGYVFKPLPATTLFTADNINRRVYFSAAAAEWGMETRVKCAYSARKYDTATYYKTNSGGICVNTSNLLCLRLEDLKLSIDLFVLPFENTYKAVLIIDKIHLVISPNSGNRYYNTYMHSYQLLVPSGGIESITCNRDASATTLVFNTTNTITKSLNVGTFTGSLTVTLTVNSTGIFTVGEMSITPDVTVTNVGAGWHDSFTKVS